MAIAKTLTGARAIIKIAGEAVGWFDSVTYALNFSAEAIHTLGRFSPNEIVTTAAESVDLQCSGFRYIDNPANAKMKVPSISSLLQQEGIQIIIEDRQSTPGVVILTVNNCVCTSYSSGYQAKSTSRIQVSYRGTAAFNEGGDDSESSGASTF